jgi:feruloyl esterase
MTLALEQWVEKGVAPSSIIATKFTADDPAKGPSPKMTHPLCPYPQAAKYKGTGDTNSAANFVCAPPN